MDYQTFNQLVADYHFEIGNRFRRKGLCHENDIEIVGHDVHYGLLIVRSIAYCPWMDVKYRVTSIEMSALDIKCKMGHYLIQIDEERRDVK